MEAATENWELREGLAEKTFERRSTGEGGESWGHLGKSVAERSHSQPLGPTWKHPQSRRK